MIRAIVAIDEQYGIAAKGKIPWTIPNDSRYFREQTEGAAVIMGAATYAEFAEPLPNRRNLVISRTTLHVRDGFELITDLKQFLNQTNEDVWIIGGAALYVSALEFCEELYITHVAGVYDCDRFFPRFESAFHLVKTSDTYEQNGHTFTFAVYKRNR